MPLPTVPIAMSITALTHLVERNGSVRVVTGLPISYYRRHRDEIARLLTGKHDVRVVDASGTATDTSITVTHVRAIPQPFSINDSPRC